MQVRVRLERQAGRFLPSHDRRNQAVGDLCLAYRTAGNRRVAVLKLLSADRQWPNLYDPKLVDLNAGKLRFVGAERVEGAWHVQEWVCELL